MTTMHDYDEEDRLRNAHYAVLAAIDALRDARKILHDLRLDGEESAKAAIGVMNRVEAFLARLLDWRRRGEQEINLKYRYRYAEVLILEGDGDNRYRLIDHYDREKAEMLQEILDDEDIELMLLGIAASNGWDISGTPYSFQ
jgi:hypothetical protein